MGVRGETGRLPRSAEDLEIPGRVAPARSGLPPRGASDLDRSELLCGRDEGLAAEGRSDVGLSDRGRSDVGLPLRSELLCGRDELLLEGRPDEGLPLEERPDVEPPLDGRDDGREPLEGGRRDSISFTPFRVVQKFVPSTINKYKEL